MKNSGENNSTHGSKDTGSKHQNYTDGQDIQGSEPGIKDKKTIPAGRQDNEGAFPPAHEKKKDTGNIQFDNLNPKGKP